MRNRGVSEAFTEAARVALTVKPAKVKDDSKCQVMWGEQNWFGMNLVGRGDLYKAHVRRPCRIECRWSNRIGLVNDLLTVKHWISMAFVLAASISPRTINPAFTITHQVEQTLDRPNGLTCGLTKIIVKLGPSSIGSKLVHKHRQASFHFFVSEQHIMCRWPMSLVRWQLSNLLHRLWSLIFFQFSMAPKQPWHLFLRYSHKHHSLSRSQSIQLQCSVVLQKYCSPNVHLYTISLHHYHSPRTSLHQ